MFSIFKRKSPKEKLLAECKNKKEMAFKISSFDRRKSDALEKEAAEILIKIEELENNK